MTAKATVDDFIAQKILAVVGVSRSGNKFGNMAYKELRQHGYKLYAVHPQAETLEGDPAYKDFRSLPESVGGVLIIVPPAQTEQVVRDAAAAGIKRAWLQQGSESETAIQFCQENGIAEVHGECIMMFARGEAFPHSIHRWFWKLLGKLPG
ncbi:MAG: CoA-binding protein [Anaerolineales bacterium]|nr:CoA-binding protein [Anaerolineales bacterium]